MESKEKLYLRLLLWGSPALFFIWNFIGITQNCLAGDEPFSYYFSEQSFQKIGRELFTGNNPPLFETILHTFTLIFGHSIIAARTLSLLFVTGAVFFTLKTSVKHYGLKHAIFTAVLLLGSNFLLKFSHEIRAYSLLLFLISAAQYCFLSYFQNKTRKHLVLLVLLNTLMIYTHYLSVFVVFCQFLTLVLWKRNRVTNIKNYVLYHLGALLLGAPLILNLFTRIQQTNGGKTWLSPPEGLTEVYNMLWKFCNKPLPTVLVLLLFVTGLVLTIKRKEIKLQFSGLYLWICFQFLFVFIFALSFKIPLFLDRYLNILILAFYLFVAHVLVSTFNKNKYYIPALLLLGLSFLFTKSTNVDNNRHLDELSNRVKELRMNKQTIVVSDLQLLPAMSFYFNHNNYFSPTKMRSELHQQKGLEEYGLIFDPSFEMSDKNPSDYILIEGGEPFLNRGIFEVNKPTHISIIEVPEIFKIISYSEEKNKTEIQ